MAKSTLDGMLKKLCKQKAKTPEKVIERMIKAFENKANWTKGTDVNYVTDKDGDETGEVETMCLIGLTDYIDGPAQEKAEKAIYAAICELFPKRIDAGDAHDIHVNMCDSGNVHDRLPEFNDHTNTTHKDLMKVLNRAKTIISDARALKKNKKNMNAVFALSQHV